MVNWLFRRHFWIVHLVLLGICCAIAGKTFSTLAGYWLLKTIPEKPLIKAPRALSDEEIEKDFEAITERNLFAARREQLNLDEMDEEQGDPGRWQDAGPSNLPLKLISTSVFFDPFDSRAIILDRSSGKSIIASVGECEPYIRKNNMSIEEIIPVENLEPERPCNSLFGLARLERIEEFRVYIFNERERKYEYLSLLEDDKTPIRRRPIASSEEGEGTGVRKLGATSYEIDQNEFDKALSNVSRLMTEARAVPELDSSGASVGFKIVYLKEGSLFEKIGIERMDVLTQINGFELNSPEKALQLFSKLRSTNKFTIDVKRGDQSIRLDYSVVR